MIANVRKNVNQKNGGKMKNSYSHQEFRAAMVLKSITIIDIVKQLKVSRRLIDYFIKGEMGMKKSEEVVNMLNPELDAIHYITKSISSEL